MGLFACSGPGAGAAIARSIEIGYTHATVISGLLLMSVVVAVAGSQRWLAPAVLLGLLAIHPAWTISAIKGDCGLLKQDASWLFTGLGCAAVGWQVGRAIWSRAGAARPEQPEP